ncbi:MAG: hypothetical protein HYX82_01465 [Chloroflexi bacterium]|nr:hypothetical protein [Chloroflexota bacterium]
MIFFAGVACGLIMGMAFIGLGAIMLVPILGSRSAQHRPIPRSVNLTYIILPLSFFIVLLWGVIGGLFGLAYELVTNAIPGRGLGSPNLVFTAFILLLSVGSGVAIMLVQRRVQWESQTLVLAFAGIFGWLMPWLAS